MIEIPAVLLRHLQPNTELDVVLRDTGRSWRGADGRSSETYLLTGLALTDPEALEQVDVPSHESCVEVGRRRKGESSEIVAGRGIR